MIGMMGSLAAGWRYGVQLPHYLYRKQCGSRGFSEIVYHGIPLKPHNFRAGAVTRRSPLQRPGITGYRKTLIGYFNPVWVRPEQGK
jgi:hypothetical protein